MSAALVILPQVWATVGQAVEGTACWERKPPHRLRLVRASAEEPMPASVPAPPQVAPVLAFYRKYTEAMLKRYMDMSLEAGRVPSLMGREVFRGRVSHSQIQSFDDVVIYVHDVGKCIGKLSMGQQHLIRRIALEGYTQEEAGGILGISLRTLARRYAEAVDRLTGMFLELGLLEPLTECQGAAF